MKRFFLFFVTALLFSSMVHAKDIITHKDGHEIEVKVLEVTNNDVKYRLFDEPDGAIYTVRKSDILMIRYESGRNEVFNNNSEVGLYYTNREPVKNLRPGMKYKELKQIYNYKEFSSSIGDKYSPALSGVCSFLIPGLGQMICGEVGRGIAFLGGSVAGAVGSTVIMNAGIASKGNVSTGAAIGSLVLAAGVLALDIIAIVDGVRVAEVKNMYEQDLKKTYSFKMNVYPSFDYAMIGNTYQPVAGLKMAVNF